MHKFNMPGILQGILLVCLAIGLTGCGEKEPETVQRAVHSADTEVAVAVSGRKTPPQVGADAGVSIDFLPVHPTAENDLWALLKGATVVSWTWKINGFEIAEAKEDHLLRSNFRKGDLITAIADTGKGVFDTSIAVGNAPPRIATVVLENTDLQNGAGISARPEGEDADGDPITFNLVWEINGIVHPGIDAPTLPREVIHEGDRVSLMVTPFDGEDSGRPFVSEEFVIPNAPPFFITSPPSKIYGDTYSYRVEGADPDGDAMTYFLEEGPPKMKFDASTGLLTWKIPADGPGDHRVRIVAEDNHGGRSVQEFDLRTIAASDP